MYKQNKKTTITLLVRVSVYMSVRNLPTKGKDVYFVFFLILKSFPSFVVILQSLLFFFF